MLLLGISAYYHDAAAALVRDGEVVAAAQEERFSRRKHDASFPALALSYVLEEAGVGIGEIDRIVFYDKPLIKFERLLETYLAEAPRGWRSFVTAIPLWIREKLYLKETLTRELAELYRRSGTGEREVKAFKKSIAERIRFSEHHLSHAASAFYPSPFDEAAVLTIDGVGEWTTTSIALGRGSNLEILQEIHFPHSLGLLYSAFTYYLGFRVNSGEYKVMGLAPYGRPRYAETIRKHLIDIREDGSFRLDMDYFDYTVGLTMTNEKFHRLFGAPPRRPESELTQREMDLAASLQEVTEEVMLRLARHARQLTGASNLCMAGGVALNCVGNGKIYREKIFDRLWIQPAAGDDGAALGAALACLHLEEGVPRSRGEGRDAMQGAALGPFSTEEEIRTFLDETGARYHYIEREEELLERTAEILDEGRVVGWHQGRMEFGPRALGHRSILGDPRDPEMQRTLNLKIKYRESFRPFAPSVLRERVAEWFEFDDDSPYMLIVAPVHPDKRLPDPADEATGLERLRHPRSLIPAVTHVDYSARIQTVTEEDHPRYYRLLRAFEARTGCPLLVNTSFNVRGEPIVSTPAESFRCFMTTEMDVLVLGDFLLFKEEQPKELTDRFRQERIDALD